MKAGVFSAFFILKVQDIKTNESIFKTGFKMKILNYFLPLCIKLGVLALVVISFSSCNTRQKDFAGIDSLRKDFHDAPTNAKRIEVGVKLDAAYKNWQEKYPDDTLTPEFDFRDGQVEAYIKKTSDALKTYQKVYTDYPKNKRAPFAMMAAANIYDDVLMDKPKAKEMYHMVIDKYPNDTLAVQAKQLLIIEDMGIENFLKQKIAADSTKKVQNQ